MKKLLASVLLTAMVVPTLLSQQPSSNTVKPRADWPVYPANKMPPGTNVTEAEIPKLAEGGGAREALYLVGTFTVTARAEDRVVLRIKDKVEPIRIVAIYPPSIPTPPEGATLIRDETRGFLITNIRRGSDDQITVYVRDITSP
ncbi:hypothetical protein ACXR0O_24595 [Verrucomicrobiota bacterium sgz303538]